MINFKDITWTFQYENSNKTVVNNKIQRCPVDNLVPANGKTSAEKVSINIEHIITLAQVFITYAP